MVEVYNDNSKEFRCLSQLVEYWSTVPEISGPGTIDLNIEEVSSDRNSCNELLEIISRSAAMIVAMGEKIPATVANERWKVPGVNFRDYDTRRLIKVLEQLKSLL